MPVVLIEAMAMEGPCVSIPEFIRNNIDGLFVPSACPLHITVAAERLIVEDGLVERIGKAGRARVEEKYNFNKNIPALAQAFGSYLR